MWALGVGVIIGFFLGLLVAGILGMIAGNDYEQHLRDQYHPGYAEGQEGREHGRGI